MESQTVKQKLKPAISDKDEVLRSRQERIDEYKHLSEPQSKSWIPWLAAFLLLFNFAYFVLPGLRSHFSYDDPMNIHYYWNQGCWALIRGLVLFYTTYRRAMGGVFFYILYELFGINPLPYHIVITLLLLINMILSFCCARLLTGSGLIGAFCAMLTSYHARMWPLVYLPAYIFDVLCFTFYYSAMLYYLRIRITGRQLNFLQTIFFILLYVAALDSKEMAVSLPLVLLLFELLWNPPSWEYKRIWRWIRDNAGTIFIGGVITAVYIIGKSLGSETLSRFDAYKIRFSWSQYYSTSVKFLNEITYNQFDSWFGLYLLFPFLFLMIFIAWRLQARHLKWAILSIIIMPLPIVFLPHRGGPMLYMPMFGWALLIASGVVAAGRYLAGKSVFRRLAPLYSQLLVFLTAFILIWATTAHHNNRARRNMRVIGEVTWSLQKQLEPALVGIKPGSRIIFMNNIFSGWDLSFLAELLCHDRSVKAYIQTKTPFSQEQIDQMDYIFEIRQEKLIVLKSPPH